jgi:hypothetical protein
MDSETYNAQSGETIFHHMLAAIKARDEVIASLHTAVLKLAAKQEVTDENYQKLVAILEKSIIKIDQQALGLN